jgi:hypothetical protein
LALRAKGRRFKSGPAHPELSLPKETQHALVPMSLT